MRISPLGFVAALFVGLSVASAPGAAQSGDGVVANPVLTSKAYFTGSDEVESRALSLTRLDVDVELFAGFAETEIIVSFHNPSDQVLEGEFVLDMPPAAVVSGYGLDINGQLIPGVVVERQQAVDAFQERIRAGIDPGLGEVTRTNAFKNRVFPINPGQTRTVSVTFVSPVTAATPYRLPLGAAAAVDAFSLRVSGDPATARLSGGGDFVLEGDTDAADVSLDVSDFTLGGVLSVTPHEPTPMAALQRHPGGGLFVSMASPLPEPGAASPDSVAVYWDASLSHRASAQEAAAFVALLAETYADADLELVRFADGPRGERSVHRGAPALTAALTDVRYHGATDLHATLAARADDDAHDVCVLVTDGRSTLGGFPQARPKCRLHVVSAAPDADRGVLSLLARQGGGAYVDLTRQSHEDALAALGGQAPVIIDVLADGQSVLEHAEWFTEGDELRVLARLSGRPEAVTLMVDGREIMVRPASDVINTGAAFGAMWARDRLVRLRAERTAREDLVSFSQTYSVVGEETSFLVLETVWDYVNNRIDLPQVGFTKEQREQYEAQLAAAIADDERRRAGRIDAVAAMWADQVAWYDTKFPLELGDPVAVNAPEVGESDGAADLPLAPRDTGEVAEIPWESRAALDDPVAEFAPSGFGGAEDERITVSGARRAPRSLAVDSSMADREGDGRLAGPLRDVGPVAEVRAWTPDRPYLNQVRGQCGSDFLDSYFDVRVDYGDAPSFYLEMADVSSRCGDTVEAASIALSALELPTANVDTLTAVAMRLMSYGAYDQALDLFRQVVRQAPHRPQSWRDLALALDEAADGEGTPADLQMAYRREALAHLNHVIATPWDNAYDGAELVSVMEANRILARLRASGGEGAALVDERLERLLDVDVRVVLTWNIDNVDMDLWVTEPTEERAYYSNPLTRLGGHMSNDMTDGYGPEEYLLKTAVPGEYQVRAHYYSSDIINPNGAVTLRAHIFRNWGRESEEVDVVDLEFTDDDQDAYFVGSVTFE